MSVHWQRTTDIWRFTAWFNCYLVVSFVLVLFTNNDWWSGWLAIVGACLFLATLLLASVLSLFGRRLVIIDFRMVVVILGSLVALTVCQRWIPQKRECYTFPEFLFGCNLLSIYCILLIGYPLVTLMLEPVSDEVSDSKQKG
jgi:hypothetical protein